MAASSSTFKVYEWEMEAAGVDPGEPAGNLSNFLEEDSDPDAEEEAAELPPGQELLNYLLQQHVSGGMNAKQVCVTCWWAWKSGVAAVKPLALPPSTKGSGDFKRAITAYLKDSFQGLYTVPVPSFSKGAGRTIFQLQTLPIHEVVEEELATLDVPSLAAAYEAPPNYLENKVVKTHAAKGQVVAPLALFMDGVAYGKKNSLLAITVQNLWTGKRWIVCCLRKRLLCKCGCRGYCTLFRVFQWVAWSLQHMSVGLMPSQRHDQEPWGPQDHTRSEVGGSKMTCPCVVLQLRADWSELLHLVGVPNWSSKDSPCFLCYTEKKEMAAGLGERAPGEPFFWRLKKFSHHKKACKHCEQERKGVTPEQWDDLKKRLYNDKGFGGRALSAAYAPLDLQKGDRLEPTSANPDWEMTEKDAPSVTFCGGALAMSR